MLWGIALIQNGNTVQNKMHSAVHGNTAAEVIVARANHNKEHMGLKSWKRMLWEHPKVCVNLQTDVR